MRLLHAMVLTAVSVSMFAFAGCGGASCPRDTTPSASTSSQELGHMQGKMATLLQHEASANEFKVVLNQDGRFAKLSVYHRNSHHLPQPVQALANERGFQVEKIESEHYDKHGDVYEINFEKDDRECELAIKADGQVLYEECEIDPKELPQQVHDAVTASFSQPVTIDEAETSRLGDKAETPIDHYRVEAKDEKQTFYLEVSPEGVVQRVFRVIKGKAYVPFQSAQ